jgi:hypothetical protein
MNTSDLNNSPSLASNCFKPMSFRFPLSIAEKLHYINSLISLTRLQVVLQHAENRKKTATNTNTERSQALQRKKGKG